MNIDPNIILLAISWFTIKHFFADFVFQSQSQFKYKHIYGHWGGLAHAGIHGVCSVPVFLILPAASLLVAVSLISAEIIVHYHLDWLKKNYVLNKGLTTRNRRYWIAFGLDQLLHMMTYIAIIYLLIQ